MALITGEIFASSSTSGHILVDRHLEKNGGTAFRDVLKEAQLNGLCMYWGFQLRSVIWSQVLDRLPSLDTPLASGSRCDDAPSGRRSETLQLRL